MGKVAEQVERQVEVKCGFGSGCKWCGREKGLTCGLTGVVINGVGFICCVGPESEWAKGSGFWCWV